MSDAKSSKSGVLRIVLIDDDPHYLTLISSYCAQFQKENALSLEIATYANGLNFIEEYNGRADLIFLDIEMPFLNGLETAKKIREKDEEVCLIFITNMAQYAIQGYEVRAMDYLVKPVTYPLFCEKMKKALRYCRKNQESVFLAPVANGVRKIDYSEIGYIESQKHYLFITLPNEIIKMRGSFKDIEASFLPRNFAFCCNSFLVNLHNISSSDSKEVVVYGKHLPISRGKRKEFLRALSSFLAGTIENG